MSANTSSSLFPSNSTYSLFLMCFRSRSSSYNLFAICAAYILLFPVLFPVLYLGYQRWKRQRSGPKDTTTPSDLFTYHAIAMQVIEFLAFLVFTGGIRNDHLFLTNVGKTILGLMYNGKTLFHLLTCVERYVAVVHPITYLQLKHAKGVRITNISIGCVWVISAATLASAFQKRYEFNSIVYVSCMSLLLVAIAFCSISVLCALKRPGPGEVGGNRGRVDQSKERAFYTIVAIMGVLLVRFGGSVSVYLMETTHNFGIGCLGIFSLFWLDLPSVLVLPLLFLHRAGKLHCGKQTTASG